MRIVIFGLSVSSSWGNGHATLWRGMIRALAQLGHTVSFFERDVPYYAGRRDLNRLENAELILYADWRQAAPQAAEAIRQAGAVILTSFCPDARNAMDLLGSYPDIPRVFYDMDTPVTLAQLSSGNWPAYLPERGLADFDLVLSYTGGRSLEILCRRLGARNAFPLYGWVDPAVYLPVPGSPEFSCDLSYLGTYAQDRQAAVDELLIHPAESNADRRFLVGGAQYPDTIRWPGNVRLLPHVSPDAHSSFYCSSRLTLSVTRGPMRENGYCPSGRLFEASACGVPIISDYWEGLEDFFVLGEELLVASKASDVTAALDLPDGRLRQIGEAARSRVLRQHTALHRARQLIGYLESGNARENPAAEWSELCGESYPLPA